MADKYSIENTIEAAIKVLQYLRQDKDVPLNWEDVFRVADAIENGKTIEVVWAKNDYSTTLFRPNLN